MKRVRHAKPGTLVHLSVLFAILTSLSSTTVAQPLSVDSPALSEFLKRFDQIESRGFIKTLRPGSTGIGYTLESLLNIEENNSVSGDFMGMEVKAYRDDEKRFDDHHKMNLFLKEPTWLDEFSTADRIRNYGYLDKEGRQAWYQSVTSKPNQAGLSLKVDDKRSRVTLIRNHHPIAFWSFDILQKRLDEKHSETVFVAAETNGTGKNEKFHFQTVTYCANPSIERFVQLVEDGDVIVELRMHVKETGAARNHGTAFRVRKHRLKDLYKTQLHCRPQSDGTN